MSILGWIFFGLISGFIASKVVAGRGSGCLLDIALGIVGAFVGGALFLLLLQAGFSVESWRQPRTELASLTLAASKTSKCLLMLGHELRYSAYFGWRNQWEILPSRWPPRFAPLSIQFSLCRVRSPM